MKIIAFVILILATASCSNGQNGLNGKWNMVNHTSSYFDLEFSGVDVIFYFSGKKHGPTYKDLGMNFRMSCVTYNNPQWFDIVTKNIDADTVFDVKKFIYRRYGDTLEIRGFTGDTTRFTSFDRNDTTYTGIFVRE